MMNLQTFQADTMAEALAKVKRALGRDAVILHTRTLKRGAVLGLGGRTVVEITATNDANVLPPRATRGIMGRTAVAQSRDRRAEGTALHVSTS
ncbi:MAG: hypothetical protein JXA69_04160, partial [Phycisphaerae bacterium]|nr:hypothetical protein [Phycisphaerae bacterium]